MRVITHQYLTSITKKDTRRASYMRGDISVYDS
jgi:hypothetical protein